MRKTVFNFVCKLQGYKTSLQNIHWNADNLSQHKLCDDIMDRISDFEDQVSEVEQSISGNLKNNRLVGTEYKTTTLKKFVEDVIDSTNEFYHKLEKFGDKYIGMRSDCESFLSDMQRNLYLVNFTLKEDFKRQYKKKINEQRCVEENSFQMTCEEFKNVVNEAVSIVVGNMNESCCEAEVVGGQYDNDELNFTHFAVNKYTNLIVDGWDYSGYDSEDLKSNKNDYFYSDLKDNGFNPNAYKILSFNACKKQCLNPNNNVNWSNTGVFPLFHEQEMMKNGEEPWNEAYRSHPDWFYLRKDETYEKKIN